MRILSPLLRRVVYPVLSSSGYFRRSSSNPLSVLTYHGILPEQYRVTDTFLDSSLISASRFREHLRLLKSHYNVISCDRFLEWLHCRADLPERAVLLTCDDGLRNNLTEMVPILHEENLSCLFFVTGDPASERRQMLWFVELYLMLMRSRKEQFSFSSQGVVVAQSLDGVQSRRRLWLGLMKQLSTLTEVERRMFLYEAGCHLGLSLDWRSRYFDDPVLRDRFTLMRGNDLVQLRNAGMAIGAHSLSHPVLAQQPADLAYEEIAESRRKLEAAGQTIWAFAYPFGEHSSAGEREFALARAAGFQCAFMNVGGTLSRTSPAFSLPRIHVSGEMRLREFEAHVSGFHSRWHQFFRPRMITTRIPAA